MTKQIDGPLYLVGAGKMGSALLSGWLAEGLDPEKVIVQDPSPPADAKSLFEQHNISCGKSPELAGAAKIIVLATKPQIFDNVLPGLVKKLDDRTLILSIAAGKTIADIQSILGPRPIVRAMPNTPAAVNAGITVAVANDRVSDDQVQQAQSLLGTVGEVAWIDEESLMDAVTAVSGSGPAYVFLLAECLSRAAEKAGLSPELAQLLARKTIWGSGVLLDRSPETASTLRSNVTSPGGTTEAALKVLMSESGLAELLEEAVNAAKKRSRELSS
ncbi:MAG: pyrroline-5-carboxylate reductase [Methyloligellaceae bacterium]